MESRRKTKYKISVDSSTPSRWNNMPSDILEMIFKNLPSLGDRIRVGAVSRHWNLVLSRAKHDILRIPDAPWKILEQHLNIPFIFEVGFKSLLDEKVYRFNLPDNYSRGWLCGSSRGWLLMASGNEMNPDLFLWNPLNGSIRNLPPLSSHPCYNNFRYLPKYRSVDIWCVFDRVEVFSHGSVECVVAAILSKHIYPRNQISFCTPGDQRWTTCGKEEENTIYIDIMYHEKIGSLWLLTTGGSHISTKETLVNLSRCTVRISFSFLDRIFHDVDMMFGEIDLPHSSLILKNARQVFRLVEDTVHEDGDVLIVATNLDREFRVRYVNGVKKATVRDWTSQVSFIIPFSENRSEELTSIGNQTAFLGSTGTNSIIISNPVKGIETDCVYLAIDDSAGYCDIDEAKYRRRFLIREQGVYFLKSKKMKNDEDPRNVGHFTMNKIGWFEPKIFLK